ncbi:helix-turn-helix transcriptional regulator [Bacillus sp. NEB1478]|uniref:helix-turn-helix transcriptional regulator n=1 Tax=Bacillus sp. NEB1478 TaxID=3073816 RepID=UPI002873A138|nr:helix-turn-helix transcriptional regulator [Bacillus sp. NEB1478]WNB92523.1 helix-turn-helix transcriptional regulator [Bacillus sp. NEB1478]
MIGKRIKEARTQIGISQRQLAGEDMTRAYISLIEKGHAIPSEKTLRIIANRLDKPLSYFMGDEDEDSTEISEAMLERAIKKAKEGHIDSALNIANRIFSTTQSLPVTVDTYFFIIETKLNQGLYDEVLDYGEEALPEILALKDRHAIVRYYMLIGKAAFRTENFSLAKKSYEKAVKYSNQLKKLQDEKIQALTFLGTTSIRLGNIKEAIEYYIEAEKEVSLTGNRLFHGQILMGLGKAYLKTCEYENSLICAEKSIALLGDYEQEKVYALHNKAIVNYMLGNEEEAIDILKECLQIYKNSNQSLKQAFILEELTKISIEKENFHKAKQYCDEAIKLLEIEEDGILRGKLYREMGQILRYEGQLDQGYYFLRMSYDLLIRLKATNEAGESLRLLSGSVTAISDKQK